jgi:hypothetical protein
MTPFGGPVANPFALFDGGGSREVGDPGIDPSRGIRDVCTVDRDFIADKKIFRDIFLHPSAISNFFFNGPPPVSHLPNLKGRFLHRLAEGGGGKGDEKQ